MCPSPSRDCLPSVASGHHTRAPHDDRASPSPQWSRICNHKIKLLANGLARQAVEQYAMLSCRVGLPVSEIPRSLESPKLLTKFFLSPSSTFSVPRKFCLSPSPKFLESLFLSQLYYHGQFDPRQMATSCFTRRWLNHCLSCPPFPPPEKGTLSTLPAGLRPNKRLFGRLAQVAIKFVDSTYRRIKVVLRTLWLRHRSEHSA